MVIVLAVIVVLVVLTAVDANLWPPKPKPQSKHPSRNRRSPKRITPRRRVRRPSAHTRRSPSSANSRQQALARWWWE